MWHRKINVANVVLYKAFSFVELLISLLLASGILLSFGHFYSQIYQNQHAQRELLALQQHSHQLLDYLQKHIQHIGYWGEKREFIQMDLFQHNQRNAIMVNNQCLIFFYDLNQDGCLGTRRSARRQCTNSGLNDTRDLAKEIFGIKYQQGELYTYQGNRLNSCTKAQCQRLLTHCDSHTEWERLMDRADYQVTRFYLSWLKENKVLKIELGLGSVKYPKVKYQVSGYSYLLN